MKKMLFSFLALMFLCTSAYADGEGADSVIAIKASDIRGGTVSLTDWQHVSTGQPDAAVLDVVKQAGFTTVVDLRGENENRGMDEASEVEARGMRYYTLPIGNGVVEDVSYDNARQLDRILAAAQGPVLVHCASGNRVGALFALRAKLAGSTGDEALALGKAAGLTRLEPVVIQRLQE
ncbi:MAG: beta-lactamase hydrolase domain-containing protein [Woeseiaceae bacterium]